MRREEKYIFKDVSKLYAIKALPNERGYQTKSINRPIRETPYHERTLVWLQIIGEQC